MLAITACPLALAGCLRPVESNQSSQSNQPGQSGPVTYSKMPVMFHVYTQDEIKQIKSLSPGEWIPVSFVRDYMVMRGSGITFRRGDYFVQPLAGPKGEVKYFLLSKNKGASLQDVDLQAAKALDGSFAEVLSIDRIGMMPRPNPETKAYVVSSGESGSIWIQVADKTEEWHGELLPFSNPVVPPQVLTESRTPVKPKGSPRP